MYSKTYGSNPVLSAGTTYDAAQSLYKAIELNGLEPKLIASYLKSKSHKSVTFGPMSFDKLGGVSSSDFVIKTIVNSKASVFSSGLHSQE